MKILLVHLVSTGDCLMVTTLAKQIKNDYPGCHLTWAISYKCKHIIENNPDVDLIWEVKYQDHESPYREIWEQVKKEALSRQRSGSYDRIFFTQIFPDNINNFDGTTRSSTFKNYPGKITVPIEPVIHLSGNEIGNVTVFAQKNNLQHYKNVILFECAPSSGQSFINPEIAKRIALNIINSIPDTIVIISSHVHFKSDSPGLIDASSLSYRENAELSKYCTYFIGCSSGITWLLTCGWAKKLPSLILLSTSNTWYSFASLKYDFLYYGLPAERITETDSTGEEQIAGAVIKYISLGSYPQHFKKTFRPSVRQIVNLYNLKYTIDLKKILTNYKVRNKTRFVTMRFYFFLTQEFFLNIKKKLAMRLGLVVK